LDQLDLGALAPIGFPKRMGAAVALLGLAVAISAWSVYAGRLQDRSSEAVEEVATAARTPEPKHWLGDDAKAAIASSGRGPSHDEFQWRPAGSGRPAVSAEGRAGSWDGVSWERMAAEADGKAGAGEGTAPPAAAGAALPVEPIPPAQQHIIRRYFGAIHQRAGQ
jgi:hypothetical protein